MKEIIVFNDTLINLNYLKYILNPEPHEYIGNKKFIMQLVVAKNIKIEFTFFSEKDRKTAINKLMELIKQGEKIQMNKFESTNNWYKQASENENGISAISAGPYPLLLNDID